MSGGDRIGLCKQNTSPPCSSFCWTVLPQARLMCLREKPIPCTTLLSPAPAPGTSLPSGRLTHHKALCAQWQAWSPAVSGPRGPAIHRHEDGGVQSKH